MSVQPQYVPIGPDQTEPAGRTLRRYLRVDRATALLVAPVDGTCSLITSTLLLTNNHVFVGVTNPRVAVGADAEGSLARFNYEEDESGRLGPTKDYPCRPDRLFAANQRLDYAVVALDGAPGRRWGRIPLALEAELERGDDVFIIGHPNGQPKRIAHAANTVIEVEPPFFRYTNDTMAGSSGSPILNRRGLVIGIHHGGNITEAYNEGVLITSIYDDLPRSVRARVDRAREKDR